MSTTDINDPFAIFLDDPFTPDNLETAQPATKNRAHAKTRTKSKPSGTGTPKKAQPRPAPLKTSPCHVTPHPNPSNPITPLVIPALPLNISLDNNNILDIKNDMVSLGVEFINNEVDMSREKKTPSVRPGQNRKSVLVPFAPEEIRFLEFYLSTRKMSVVEAMKLAGGFENIKESTMQMRGAKIVARYEEYVGSHRNIFNLAGVTMTRIAKKIDELMEVDGHPRVQLSATELAARAHGVLDKKESEHKGFQLLIQMPEGQQTAEVKAAVHIKADFVNDTSD